MIKNFARFTILLVLVLFMSLFVNTAAYALQEGPTELTLTVILMWIIAGPGVAVIVGWLMAYVFENFSWWHNIPSQVKFLITIALSGLLPVLATLLLNWPGLSTIEPWVNMVIYGIVMWLSSQEAYLRLKALPSKYGIR